MRCNNVNNEVMTVIMRCNEAASEGTVVILKCNEFAIEGSGVITRSKNSSTWVYKKVNWSFPIFVYCFSLNDLTVYLTNILYRHKT